MYRSVCSLPAVKIIILLSSFATIMVYFTGFGDAVEVDRSNENHPCQRLCEVNSKPMTCQYQFEVENYYTMSKACYDCPYNITDCYRPDCIAADGVPRMVTVVNRTLPGPSIQVCVGDTVIVDVTNALFEESTTIHWHGLHQRGTPYMDGVPFITQCPIQQHETFQYKFKAHSAGTNFWHSHMGCQRSDGVFGALIIRKPHTEEFHSSFYSVDLPEHVIQISDWTHQPVISKMMEHFHAGGNNKPDSILINGRGRHRKFNGSSGYVYTPITTFNVKQGVSYRFRIIYNGFLNCPIAISFDHHGMIIISSDGSDVQPIYIESLVIYAGERWDIVVNANQNISNYWIRFRGLLDCGPQFNSVFATAILHYEGAANELPETIVAYNNSYRNGLELNALNKGSGEFDYASVAEIRSVQEDSYDPVLLRHPDVALTLAFDFYPIDNPLFHKKNLYGFYQVSPSKRIYTPQISHISLALPSYPLLSERGNMKPDLCKYSNINTSHCEDRDMFCHCTFIIDIPLDAVVEIILIDKGKIYEANHPFHLHGGSFRVLALEKLGNFTTKEQVELLNNSDHIHRNFINPPIKDTVTIPDGGFTIIRFYASNPGYWLMHCHLDFHMEVGMGVIFKVGKDEEMPPVPEGFPTCGNYFQHSLSRQLKSENEIISFSKIEHFFSNILRSVNMASSLEHFNNYCILTMLPIMFYLIV